MSQEMSEAFINEVGSLILDGRIDGIVGNTIAQNCFGNNFATVIGRGTQFNIDWIKFLSKIGGPKINIPDISSILKLLGKPIEIDGKNAGPEDTRTGFFEQTVGDTFSLQSHGKLWDFTRGVEKTEFAMDPNYTSDDNYKDGKELESPIEYIIAFNLCTCVALQVMTIYSSIISESDQESNATENSLEIMTILQLIIYGIFPVINQYYARLVQTLEVTLFLAFKEFGDEAIADAKSEKETKQLEDQGAILQDVSDQVVQTQGAIENVAQVTTDITQNLGDTQAGMIRYNQAERIWKKENKWKIYKSPRPELKDYLPNINSVPIPTI